MSLATFGARRSMAVQNTFGHDQLYQDIDLYPWGQDREFQTGLRAIVGSNTDPDQVRRLTLRAQCFYYARKNEITVDFPEYEVWHSTHGRSCTTDVTNGNNGASTTICHTQSAPATGSSNTAPPYPMTFNQIVELISTGAPIPGIKDIPDTLLEGQGTLAAKPPRKKPWERDVGDVEEHGD